MSRQRNIDEIMADPQASEEELIRISVDYRGIVLHHPNCPREIWWEKAERLPIEAITSPAYPLMTLESPERWSQLESIHASSWLGDSIPMLPERELRLFAADCAEHTLPIYEAFKFHRTTLRKVLQTIRLSAEGESTKDELMAARAEAFAAYDLVQKRKPVYFAARAVYEATGTNATLSAKDAATCATYAAYHAAEVNGDDEGVRMSYLERVWQWHRLLSYLRGDQNE